MKREEGYYHVKYKGEWEIAKRSEKENEWCVPGSNELWTDSAFEEIDENRIVRTEKLNLGNSCIKTPIWPIPKNPQ